MLIPSGMEEQLDYVRRYVFFVLLFAFVGSVKCLLVRLFGGDGKAGTTGAPERVGRYIKRPLVHRGREIVEIVALVGSTLIMLASLQAYRAASPPEIFPLIVLAILAGAVESRLAALGTRPGTTALVAIVSGSALSFLSIFASTELWVWQTLIVCLAFGALSGAASLASALERSPIGEPRHRKMLSRGLIITLTLGPIMLGILVQFRELGLAYLLTFLIIPLFSASLRGLKDYEESGTTPPRLTISVAAASLLFVVIVCGVSVVYR